VFMGTPGFAVPSLRALAARHDVVAVYTRPDAISGRGSSLRATPVKLAAADLGIDILQPATLRDPAVVSELEILHPDVLVVAAYGLILPPEVLAIPAKGALNVHASLLPRWRGAAPIERAILAGDERTGVSIMRMEEGLDTGPYCRVASTEIDDKSAAELEAELAHIGADALLAALDEVEAGTCTWTTQDAAGVTYAEKIGKAELLLAPAMESAPAYAAIRASSRRAPARLLLAGAEMTVAEAQRSAVAAPAGEALCTSDGMLLGFSDGALLVTRVKPEGKPEMDASAFCRGAHLAPGTKWERVTNV
jgi:methionyl-tRNA formyltransferase